MADKPSHNKVTSVETASTSILGRSTSSSPWRYNNIDHRLGTAETETETNRMDTSTNHPNNNTTDCNCNTFETMSENDDNSTVEVDVDIDMGNAAQWDRLPQEILTKIFSYLTISETDLIENTCVSWKRSCNVPYLWRRMEFNFDGADSLRLVSKGLRAITTKGHFLRDLVLSIGNPGLNQAWLMSGCIQQLLDFISQQSSSCFLESFTINNLTIFTQNRFFGLSKESTLNSLNTFLRSQRNLKSVSFTYCKFNPSEGLKLLRTLKSSASRNTLKKLELHNFFKRRYVSGTRAFKIVSSFSALEEISVDSNYIDDGILCLLTETRPHRKPFRHLRIYFEALKPPPASVSRESWLTARQSCLQELKVSFHFCGWLAFQWIKPFLMDYIPLVECVVCWKKLYRGPRTFYTDLTLLLDRLTTQNSSHLERFTLSSGMRSFPELDDALVRLVTYCTRLTEVNVLVTLSDAVIATISSTLAQRRHPVKCRFQSIQRPLINTTLGLPIRNRGC